MVDDPTARAMVGFLLVRGGVHIVAYSKALEKLTGVDVGKLLPIPDISNKRFPESRKHEERGLHQILYRFNAEDYKEVGAIWNGPHPEDGSELRVQDASNEGFTPPDLEEEPQLTAPIGPDIDPEMFKDVATKLFGSGVTSRSGKTNGKTAKTAKARR